MDNPKIYVDKLVSLLFQYIPVIVLALVTLITGLWIIGIINKTFDRLMSRNKVDETLQRFSGSMLNILLKTLLLISVASMVGITTTSFIAVIGAAGLAVGLALQGSLSNFAGGVVILLFRPFNVGDFVEMLGFSGVIKEIQVFKTTLTTGDNKTIIMPNGPIANGNIVNYSTESCRRVDMGFGIGKNDDIDNAKNILYEIIKGDNRILSKPAPPFIAVSFIGDTTVNIVVRVWVGNSDYWGVYFDMQEKVWKTFATRGLPGIVSIK